MSSLGRVAVRNIHMSDPPTEASGVCILTLAARNFRVAAVDRRFPYIQFAGRFFLQVQSDSLAKKRWLPVDEKQENKQISYELSHHINVHARTSCV